MLETSGTTGTSPGAGGTQARPPELELPVGGPEQRAAAPCVLRSSVSCPRGAVRYAPWAGAGWVPPPLQHLRLPDVALALRVCRHTQPQTPARARAPRHACFADEDIVTRLVGGGPGVPIWLITISQYDLKEMQKVRWMVFSCDLEHIH